MQENNYQQIEDDGAAFMRGLIHTYGMDVAATHVGAHYGEDVPEGMRIRGMLLAAYRAGQLASADDVWTLRGA